MNNTSDSYTSPINQYKYYQDYLIGEKNIFKKNINLKISYNQKKEKGSEETIPRHNKIK